MSVIVKNVIKTFGHQKAVNDISFEAKEGQILGFLGPNGAGKSTTMKIATCYIPPTSGSISICGFDVIENPIEVKKNIGYLPEHNPLYLDMYVHEYLQFCGSAYGLKGKFLRERTSEMVALFGLTKEQNKKIGTLSKGYRQRVGLAQALLHDPKVLILDEPTTGLDPNQLVEIRNLIKKISKNKTVIFSTHIMQEVQALCDEVVIINQGNIVANRKVSELQSLIDGGGQKITIETKENIDTNIFEHLAIRSIEKEGNIFTIIPEEGIDLRESIFKTSIDKSFTLLELRSEKSSLEEVFQQVTQNK